MKAIDLKLERVKRRITLKELSNKMDRSIGWLSNLENNRMKITPLLIGQYMESLSNLENGN